MEIQRQQPACHVCGGISLFLMTKDTHPLFRCSACGLVFMHPLPQPQFLKEKVYSRASGYQGNKPKDLSTVSALPWWGRLFSQLQTHTRDARLLDVGCSNGEFMYAAKAHGYTVTGVELNPATAEIAQKNGLDVRIGTLDDAAFLPETFDSIFLGDVIEHVTDPRAFVRTCAQLLSPSGILVISTPNLDCWWSRATFFLWKQFGIPWSSVTPPHHTFQFSVDNLHLLVSKEGLTPLLTWYRRAPRLLYELGSLHFLRRLKKERSVSAAVACFLGFFLYTVLYGIDVLITPLKKKDFSMVALYKKNA